MFDNNGTIKIKGKPIFPNPYFMDIFKKVQDDKSEQPSLFDRYESDFTHVRKIFSDLPQENQFWLYNGENIENLYAMCKAFEKMDSEIYAHHTSNGRNDFADWVNRVYKDAILFNALLKCKNAKEAKEAVQKRVLMFQTESANEKPKHNSIFSFFLHWKKEENDEFERKVEERKKKLFLSQVELELKERQSIELHNRLNNRYEQLKNQEKLIMEKIEDANKKNEILSAAAENENIKLQNAQRRISKERMANMGEAQKSTDAAEMSSLNDNPAVQAFEKENIQNKNTVGRFQSSRSLLASTKLNSTTPIPQNSVSSQASDSWLPAEHEKMVSKIKDQHESLDLVITELNAKKNAFESLNLELDEINKKLKAEQAIETKGQAQLEFPKQKNEIEQINIEEGLNEIIYLNIEKLLDKTLLCLKNNDFIGAKNNLDNIKFYYDSLSQDNSLKKDEFRERILLLKKNLLDATHDALIAGS